jgi:hypothetical protein
MKKEKWSFERVLMFCADVIMFICLILIPVLSKLELLIITIPFALFILKMAFDIIKFKTNDEFDNACADAGDRM